MAALAPGVTDKVFTYYAKIRSNKTNGGHQCLSWGKYLRNYLWFRSRKILAWSPSYIIKKDVRRRQSQVTLVYKDMFVVDKVAK